MNGGIKLLKIKIGYVLKVKPSDALVEVSLTLKYRKLDGSTIVWLKDYWKTKYNIILPRFFDIIQVRFPSHNKIYEYPKYRKCIRKPLRQKKAKKQFKAEQNQNLN